jgi:hypothetical protein
LFCVAAFEVVVTRIDQPESPPIPTVAWFAGTATALIVEALAQHLVVVAVWESVPFLYLPIA